MITTDHVFLRCITIDSKPFLLYRKPDGHIVVSTQEGDQVFDGLVSYSQVRRMLIQKFCPND